MIRTKTFPNGLRLIVKPMEGLFSVTMGVLVGTGGAYETDEEDGLSHFIEHVQFKGTPTRTAEQISDAFDRIGAQVNAFTGKDMTCYYSKATVEHVDEAFEILSDLFLNAVYPADELDRERGVVLEEIAMNEDTPDDLALDLLSQAYYGNAAYGRTILGSADNVKRFGKEDILKYKAERYAPDNAVIAMAGDINFQKACDLVEKYFSDWKGKSVKRAKTIAPQSRSLVKTKPIEQVHLALTFPALPRDDALSDALQLINLILGGGMSSRLFLQIREKSGLAYTVYSYVSAYAECGNLSVYAGVNDKNADSAYEQILAEIRRLKSGGITEEEFSKGREQMKASLMFAQESTSSQMLLYGKNLLLSNKIFSFEEKLNTINSMTLSDVERCLSGCFDENKMAAACVGKRDKALPLK